MATDESDEGFSEFVETDTRIDARVQKPMDEVMDAQGRYSTALRQSIGSGEVNGHTVSLSVDTSGVLRVEYDDGPCVWYSMDSLVTAATDAARNAGYLEDKEVNE